MKNAPSIGNMESWITRRRTIRISKRPLIMGIINVTPDSFFDGGRYDKPDAALQHAESLIQAGADILDIGGESTRPGSAPVSVNEEKQRVLPLMEALAKAFPETPISIDTTKNQVATEALKAGAEIVNDISGGEWDDALWPTVAESGAGYVLMHCQGRPATMQAAPQYTDVVSEVGSYLTQRLAEAQAAGIHRDHVVVDPGIGFGKTLEHNLQLLSRLESLGQIGRPILVGLSRKSFIRKILGDNEEATFLGSLVSQTLCYTKGARLWRVHDVAAARKAAQLIEALETI